ncbi:hypothetical protein M5D96_004363 [Drosophila gunungcola]|uniref:Elongator complex protein 4 n=1 Tax=Drosophila gunungcola TaxID=103775 RepID=A0A9P9YTW0_9MUSC|nr:hypothetical protein M5D96_004363 [Drosophila gunungcola]
MTSFRKRTVQKPIRGTRTSPHTAQVITSSGNPYLDVVLAKYFLAEGVLSKQEIFLGSLDDLPAEMLRRLPKPLTELETEVEQQEEQQAQAQGGAGAGGSENGLRIAWRYNDLPLHATAKIGHHFNLMEQMDSMMLYYANTTMWDDNYKGLDPVVLFESSSPTPTSLEQQPSFVAGTKKNLCRVCLTSLGSPLWYDEHFGEDLIKFLTLLMASVRNCNSVCLITMPMHLIAKYDASLVPKIRQLSFAGSERETHPAFKEYSGLLHLHKMSALNTLAVHMPDTTDLAFKLRRKKFVIEKFHLPPELQESSTAAAAKPDSCISDVEEWLYGEEAEDDVLMQRAQKFWSLAMCKQDIGYQESQLQLLRDLSGVIRSMRDENQASYSNTHDNWANIIGISPASAYLSTYLLTLTIPGAKSYGIFDEDVIEQVLKIFKLLELNGNKSVRANTIWMFFLTICDDLKLVFRYVHFKEHLKPRDRIIRCLMEKQVIFGLLLASVLVCIAGQDEEDYQEPPTVLIALLVRNKAHTLPMFLSYLDQQDYPKQRIAFWLRCDHSNDDSIDILRNWLDNSADLYQSVKYVFEPQDRSYLNESSPYEWPASRFKHLIAMKEEAFQYGREIWADFMFFLDADDYYYRRTDEYKEIYHVKKQGSFPVPMVHTAVLVNMNHRVVRRNLTFDKSRLLEMQRSRQQEPLYEGPADDIILVNLRALMVNDLGGVPPLLDYYKHLAKKPEKSKLSLDRIFMINLKRRPERREKMEQLFEELGIEAEYFPAELTTERLQEMGVRFLPGYEDPYHHRAMTMGEIGCFLSHYSIWVMMVRKGLKEVLILEDDIRFEPYFRQNAVRFLNQARSARLKEESEPFVANADNLVHAGYSYWTLGYVLSLQGALKLLAAKPLEKLIPVDEFLPLMFDRHPNKTWSEAFPKRNLVALRDSSYISDTEDSQQINVDTSEEGEARLKSDREQVFDQAEECTLDKQLKLGESLPKSHQELVEFLARAAANVVPTSPPPPMIISKCSAAGGFDDSHLFVVMSVEDLLASRRADRRRTFPAPWIRITPNIFWNCNTNEHNGDVYETLHLIMRQTFPMHVYTDSPHSIGAGRRGEAMKNGEHISDWFIQLIDKYPDILIRILHFYIECVVTNPIRAWKNNDEKVAIGYAAKYDRILYAKCNKSCADFVLDAVKADDAVGIQTRALDLIEKILMQQSEVEWSIFRYDVSKVPREVILLKEACQVLILALKQGSPMTTKILDECIRFVQFEDANVESLKEPSVEQNELRFEKPGIVQYAFSFEGHEELEAEVKNVPQTVLVLVNPLIIYNTNFVRETSLLAVDRLASVRKSALDTIETLLEAYSNCFALICVYCRIWACLMSDVDAALQKVALLSFDRMVLKNIQPLEYSNEAKHFMPWRIISTLLMTQPRSYLQERFSVLLEGETIVTPTLVNTIISHLSTSMATDAWGLLLLLSSRITNNMDALIGIFNGLSSYNMKSNQFLALQLIIGCLGNFSKPALNHAVNLLNQIHHLSASQDPATAAETPDWQLSLLGDLARGILSSAQNFQNEHTRLQCLLGAYTEIIVMLPMDVDERILRIVIDKLNESEFDTDNERMTNWMIVIAGRLCLRDYKLAKNVSKLYSTILTKNDRPQIINTTMIALNDLGQKHPTILEINFQDIAVRTFRCVKDVMLSGNIKLKGPILISMLAGLLDDSAEVAREADSFFIRYRRLYDKKLFAHCLKECPFDLNGLAYLRGPEMAKSRRLLYNHIVASVDEYTLLLHFGQLKKLADHTKKKVFVSTPGSLTVVQDILFIMRRICFHTKGNNKDTTDEGAEESVEAPSPPPRPAAGEAPAPTRERGRKAQSFEEPSVMNSELRHSFESFCRALAMRFPKLIAFAQPAQFWHKYRSTRTQKGGKRKRRRADEDAEDDSDEDQQLDSDSDNEMPLDRHKSTPVVSHMPQRKTSCDMLVTELIFQPPDW